MHAMTAGDARVRLHLSIVAKVTWSSSRIAQKRGAACHSGAGADTLATAPCHLHVEHECTRPPGKGRARSRHAPPLSSPPVASPLLAAPPALPCLPFTACPAPAPPFPRPSRPGHPRHPRPMMLLPPLTFPYPLTRACWPLSPPSTCCCCRCSTGARADSQQQHQHPPAAAPLTHCQAVPGHAAASRLRCCAHDSQSASAPSGGGGGGGLSLRPRVLAGHARGTARPKPPGVAVWHREGRRACGSVAVVAPWLRPPREAPAPAAPSPGLLQLLAHRLSRHHPALPFRTVPP